jgi:hypothetical protein
MNRGLSAVCSIRGGVGHATRWAIKPSDAAILVWKKTDRSRCQRTDRIMAAESKPPKWMRRLEEGDLWGCFLDIAHVFMYFWIAGTVFTAAFVIWAACMADPSVMDPDSLNRDSPAIEKAVHIGFVVFLVAFGVLWLFLIRFLRRRSDGPEG